MNIPIRKSLTLLSLLALVVAPIVVLAITYNPPITINNPAPAVQDFFGASVAIDGDKFVVGAKEDDTGATNAGSAYLYNATTGALLHTFSNPTPAFDDQFGWSVSISGNKVLIGAVMTGDFNSGAGSAYLYDATSSALLQTFNNPAPATGDHFGWSVSISGDKVLIGAHNDDTGATNAGSAYLYNATTGALLQTINNPAPAWDDRFGSSVSISGDKILIGAKGDNIGAGSAYLYNATTGSLLQTFNNPTPATDDSFGSSVSISGDKVLVGALYDNFGGAAPGPGSAYLYDAITGALLQAFNNPTPDTYDVFGVSVSISGDKILIGASGDETGVANAADAGSAHLYDATTGALLQTFNNPTPAFNDSFGWSVSISDDRVLIGAVFDRIGTINAGSVYLYLPLLDTDGDGIEDDADNCPADANADQIDTDGDGQGNLCDFTPNGDTDGDGVDNLADNCPGVANAGQEDNDGDGIGNICDPTPDGDPDPNPTSIEQCKQLGWMNFGFRNQGQCVAFVNTGNDSR